MILNGLRICELVVLFGDRASPHDLFIGVESNYLALIFIHEHLSILRLVYLLREVFKCEVHHDLPIEVPGVDQVIDVEAFAVIERAHCVPEDPSINENLPVYLPPCSQVVERRPFHEPAKEALDQEGQHAR